jgi:hypothetical protein
MIRSEDRSGPSRRSGLGQDLAAEHEGPRIAPLHQRPCDDAGAGALIGNAIEIDIVQDARSIQRKRTVAKVAQLAAIAVLRAKFCGQTQHIFPRGRRDENLHLDEIGRSAGLPVFFDALATDTNCSFVSA